jgi:hypothetical protein
MPSSYGKDWGRQFAAPVIRGLGGQVTPEKVRFFDAWARAEGTQAAYNPFATTRKGYQGETSFNSVGVKNYTNARQGIQATIDTLNLSYYTNLTNLLRDPNATAEDLAKAVAASPWGTGTGVLRVLGVTQSDGYEKSVSTAKYGQQKAQLEEQYQKQDSDLFRPSEAYVAMLKKSNPFLGNLAESYEPLDALTQQVVKTKGFQPLTPATQGYQTGEGGFIPSVGVVYKGEKMILPTTWKSTHVTDGLSNEGFTHAEDIMGHPGTPLGAPESGTIEYYHPTGAQGGGSIMFRADSGREYWFGHIQSDVEAGTHIKRGQTFAAISADHPNPHVHIDYRGGPQPKKKKKR